MGLYINPSNSSKEKWLAENATRLSSVPTSHCNGDNMVVCLVDNGWFTAAAVAYSSNELAAFNYPEDLRPKTWYEAPIGALAQVLVMREEDLRAMS